MNALVLAAGFGTRMLPVTRQISKVSLPLAGVPGIVRVLRQVRRAGVDRCVVNLHHGAESVRRCLEAFGEGVQYSPESEILGTAGALAQAAEFLEGGGTFLLVNGDCSYGEIPLEAALRFHRERGALATLLLLDMPRDGKYGAVELDSQARVVRISGRPEGAPPGERALHFCGIHLLEPELLTRVRPVFSEIMRELYLPLIASGESVYGYHASFAWRDLGAPERYLEASFEFLRREAPAPEHSVLGPGCVLEPDSRVGPLADLGAEVRVGRDSLVERSVLGAGVRIGNRCLIRDCVLAPAVELPDGTVMEKALAAPGADGVELHSWVGV